MEKKYVENVQKKGVSTMKLNNENYFSSEANWEYMSTSQFKSFVDCEAKTLAELKGKYIRQSKDCFLEGHFFEALICNEEEDFINKNPQMLSSKGKSKGELKSNFVKVKNSADFLKNQSFLHPLLEKSKKQVIVTGLINGIKWKGCIDFLLPDFGIDTKCMKDFKKIYSEEDKKYMSWFFSRGYHYQMSVYKELTGLPQKIIGVSKEETPDIEAFELSSELLDNAIDIIKHYTKKFNDIKKGKIEAESCNVCDFCKTKKQIKKFETIDEYK